MSLPRPVVTITDSVCDVTRDSGAPGVGDKVIIITELSLTSSMVREVRVTVSVTYDDDPEYDDTGDTVTVRLDWTSLR